MIRNTKLEFTIMFLLSPHSNEKPRGHIPTQALGLELPPSLLALADEVRIMMRPAAVYEPANGPQERTKPCLAGLPSLVVII
jgi:hypothetical protein